MTTTAAVTKFILDECEEADEVMKRFHGEHIVYLAPEPEPTLSRLP